MQLIKRARIHKCVYWGKPISTGLEKRTSLPVECKCRWDDKTTVIRLRKGGEYTSNATVLMDRITEDDGYLYKGTMDDLKSKYAKIDDPRDIPEANIIKKTETLTTLKNADATNMDKTAHWVYL